MFLLNHLVVSSIWKKILEVNSQLRSIFVLGLLLLHLCHLAMCYLLSRVSASVDQKAVCAARFIHFTNSC
jgi:predicted aspartyl protease